MYDDEYVNMDEVHLPMKDMFGRPIAGKYKRSQILPLYYVRNDTINEIEDYYHLKGDDDLRDFSEMSGSEVSRNKTTNTFDIWTHAKAVDMQQYGRMRGNMHYKENLWYVQINPMNIIECNEPEWKNGKVPIVVNNDVMKQLYSNYDTTGTVEIPEKDREIVKWNWETSLQSQAKIKDKYVRIRIRYTGNQLAVIRAVQTLYTISYS